MTKTEIQQKAEEYADSQWQTKDPVWSAVNKAYIAGVNMLLESSEYKELVANMRTLEQYQQEVIVSNHIAYTDGVTNGKLLVETSDEYKKLVEDAGKWNAYSEEAKSLQKKLSVNWDKVEKWNGLIERLNGMLINYTEEERTSTMANEIKLETHWIVSLLTKYELPW